MTAILRPNDHHAITTIRCVRLLAAGLFSLFIYLANDRPEIYASESVETVKRRQTFSRASTRTNTQSASQKFTDFLPKFETALIYSDRIHTVTRKGMKEEKGRYLFLKFSQPIDKSLLEANMPLVIQTRNKQGIAVNMGSEYFGFKSNLDISTHPADFKSIFFQPTEGNTQKKPVHALAFKLQDQLESTGVLLAPLSSTPVNLALKWSASAKQAPVKVNKTSGRLKSSGRLKNSSSRSRGKSKKISTSHLSKAPKFRGNATPFPVDMTYPLGTGINDEMVFYSEPDRAVWVYYPQSKTFERRIPSPEKPILACGGDKIVIYQKKLKKFTIYSLKTGDIIKSYPSRYNGDVEALAMGSHNGQTCFVGVRGESSSDHFAVFMNLETGEPGSRQLSLKKAYKRVFSESGRAFTSRDLRQVFWGDKSTYDPYLTTFHQGAWRQDYATELSYAGWPLSNGRICNRVGEVFEWRTRLTDSKRKENSAQPHFPIHGSVFCVKLFKDTEGFVIDPESDRKLFSLGTFPDLKDWPRYDKERFIHFNADTGNFLYLNYPQGQLIQKKIDLWGSLDRSGQPYLSVSVENLPKMIQGTSWNHELKVHSSDSNISYRLVEAPDGMTLQGNRLSWQVPPRWSVPPELKLEIVNPRIKHVLRLPLMVYERTDQGLQETKVVPGMSGDQSLVQVPESMTHARHSMDGRYLGVRLEKSFDWLFIDIVERKILSRIKKPGNYTAMGGTKFVAYDDDAKTFHVYDILSGKKVKTIKNPMRTESSFKLTMGGNNDLEVLLAYSSIQSHDSGMAILNLKTGKAIRLKASGVPKGHGLQTSNLKSDPNLKALASHNVTLIRRSGHMISASYHRTSTSSPAYNINNKYVIQKDTLYTPKFQVKRKFEVKDASISAMRPVLGADLLVGKCTRENIYLFEPGSSEPIQKWADKIHEIYTRNNNFRGYEDFMISAKLGLGYIIPSYGQYVVIGSYKQNLDGGRRNPAITNLASTIYVNFGQRWTFDLQVKDLSGPGTYVLLKHPKGMTISQQGTLNWQVPRSFDPRTMDTEVVVEVRDNHGGANKQTFKLMPGVIRLNDEASWQQSPAGLLALKTNTALFATSHDSPHAAISEENNLYSLDPKTLRPLKALKLDSVIQALHIRQHQLFVAQSGKLSVYQLPALTLIKAYPLPTKSIHNIAANPTEKSCYLAAIDDGESNEVFRNKIMHVNQTTGKVTWLKETYGEDLIFNSQGNQLITTVSGKVVSESRFVTYWGDKLTVSHQSYRSILMRYQMKGSQSKLIEISENATGAPRYFDMSGDGKSFSLVGKHLNIIPAYKTSAIGAIAARFETGRDGMALGYHPYLPQVVAGTEEKLYLFDTSGKRIEKSLATDLTVMKRIHFSALGDKFIVRGQDPMYGLVLKTIDLGLSPAQLAKARKITPGLAEATETGPLSATAKGFTKISAKAVSPRDLTGLTSVPSRIKKSLKDIARLTNPAVVMIRHPNGSGTGTFISSKGYILTCAHVLPIDNKDIKVLYKSALGKTTMSSAQVIARDDFHDLALIKSKSLVRVKRGVLARNDLETGDTVSAIGHPGMGDMVLGYTMTSGIVSTPKRQIRQRTFIQTSASINPGMSGGPLLDEFGNLIGVVSMKAAQIEGVGFAIHHSDVKEFLKKCFK